MRSGKKIKKAKEVFDQTVVASVIEEMTQPRIAKSAQVQAHRQSKEMRGKSTGHRAGETGKARIEQYGTGTPTVRKKS